MEVSDDPNDLVKDNKQVTWYKTLKDKVPECKHN